MCMLFLLRALILWCPCWGDAAQHRDQDHGTNLWPSGWGSHLAAWDWDSQTTLCKNCKTLVPCCTGGDSDLHIRKQNKERY